MTHLGIKLHRKTKATTKAYLLFHLEEGSINSVGMDGTRVYRWGFTMAIEGELRQDGYVSWGIRRRRWLSEREEESVGV